MTIETMKLALDALEYWQKLCLDNGRASHELGAATNGIAALRQAIEQEEQEWSLLEATQESLREHMAEIKRLRAALEQAEKQEHDLNDVRCECCGYMTYHREHMGCIKAAYQQAEKQEPVAYAAVINGEIAWDADYPFSNEPFTCFDDQHASPLYLSPPKREWQGLTDEAIWSEYQTLWPFHPAEEPRLAKDVAKFSRAIEDKLREKNGG